MPKITRVPSPFRQVFGGNLRAARRARGVALFDLAHATGVDFSYISQIERDARNVGIDLMDTLAQAVGVPLVQLLTPAAEATGDAEPDAESTP